MLEKVNEKYNLLWENPFPGNLILRKGRTSHPIPKLLALHLSMKAILTCFRENMKLVPVQILRWLMQPEVWRCVGFASTFVGLVSYALSSSFNYLFGKWNLLKIFLYSIFSLFICLVSLFAKLCQHSPSLSFKAHSALLVLTITSVYSFFSDKVMNGKPDAFSLISCAAFAIMSLSLSRQIHCGFEVDLLYFFLAGLIVQLMKIKLVLAIVGIGFSYALIILRCSLDAIPDEYLGVQDQEEHSLAVDINSIQFGRTMQQLMTCMKTLQLGNSYLTDMLLGQVKEYLEGKSELLVTDHNFVIEALPLGTVNDLHEAVKLMVSLGFEKECSDVYTSVRRECLEECLINILLGLRQINIKEPRPRMEFAFEDYIIERWTKASKVVLKILFSSERKLYNCIFSGFSSVADLCFTEICRGATIHLLNFADAVASGSPSVRRLFNILSMFETLRDLILEFQSLSLEPLVNEVITIQNRLGQASRDIFVEFRNLLFCVPAMMLDVEASGRVHPITLFVMRYLDSACQSQQILEQILQEYPKVGNGEESSSFSAQMDQIMDTFEIKLVTKSKNFKDLALRYFFMMNNRRYIEHMANERELGTILGNDWFQRNSKKVQRNIELYQSNSWYKVLNLLKSDNNETMESMKDKLNLFNKHFKEICSAQSTWMIFDEQQREQIIISLENILLPAYGNFIGRFQDVLGKQAYEYIKYGMFDIQDQLNHLFLGSVMNQ